MPAVRDADIVLNGTVRPSAFAPATDAIAIRDGKVAALGAGDCAALTGTSTQVIETDGVVVPGFIDAHIHPAVGGLERTRCDLTDLHSLDGYRERIRDRAAAQEGPWVLGAGWYGDVFPGGFPAAGLLDELVPGRPAAFSSHDAHSVWVNTPALRAAGINDQTPDPAGGRIVRDAAGRATGLLMEGAMELVRSLIPEPSAQAMREALLEAQRYLHSLGIIGWQDAGVGTIFGYPDTYPVYRALDADGSLTARVTGALWWDFTGDESQFPLLAQRRVESAGGRRFRGTTAKIIQDGVCENFTAAVLEPYRGHDHETGLSFIAPENLIRYTGMLAEAGFDLHIHAVGDRAVREALDALERLPRDPDARHQIAHIDLIDDHDVPRLAKTGAIANVSPMWAREDKVLVETKLPYLTDKQARRHFAFATLRAAGTELAFGSDWPVSSPDPLWALHVAVNRTAPRDDPHAQDEHAQSVPLLGHEAVSQQHAFDAATRGAARASRLDGNGTLHPGMAADFAILDADPLQVSPGELSAIRVRATYVAGAPVYTAD